MSQTLLVSQVPATTGEITPEYVRVKAAVKMTSLSRVKLYEHINDGSLKSFSVRDPGKTRGVRLIAVADLRKFIESHLAVTV